MTMTPKQRKKYEKKLRKARERFRESARELIRLYCEGPDPCFNRIEGMILPGAPGFLRPWTVLLGPSVVMSEKASGTAKQIREEALNQVKAKLGPEKYEELHRELTAMLSGVLGTRTQEENKEGQND